MSVPLYGVWLNLRDRLCVVVGGGAVATRRVGGLLECGARVHVVAPKVTGGLIDLCAAGRITLRRGTYQEGDLHGAFLVYAAASAREVNALVWRDARAMGALAAAADDPEGSDLHVGAVVRRGPIALALGTGGLSPTATAALRSWLSLVLTPQHQRAVELLGAARGRPTLAPAVEEAARLLAGGDAAGAVAALEKALDLPG